MDANAANNPGNSLETVSKYVEQSGLLTSTGAFFCMAIPRQFSDQFVDLCIQ